MELSKEMKKEVGTCWNPREK